MLLKWEKKNMVFNLNKARINLAFKVQFLHFKMDDYYHSNL